VKHQRSWEISVFRGITSGVTVSIRLDLLLSAASPSVGATRGLKENSLTQHGGATLVGVLRLAPGRYASGDSLRKPRVKKQFIRSVFFAEKTPKTYLSMKALYSSGSGTN
jgi:hypothetical protein